MTLKLIALCTITAFVVGFGTGFLSARGWYRTAELKAQLENYRVSENKYREALGLGEVLDSDAEAADKANEEILHAIRKRKPIVRASRAEGVCSDSPVCLTVDGMRDIAKLK